MLPAIESYYQRIRKIPPLRDDEELFLIRRAQEGDMEARNTVVRHNLRFVLKRAGRLRFARIDTLELVAEGNLGLFDAIRCFDMAKNFQFLTYASFFVNQHIRRYIQNNIRTVRIPIYVQDFKRQYQATIDEFKDELGRLPTRGEVAVALQVSVQTVRSLEYSEGLELSINAPIGDEENTELGDLIACAEPSIRFDSQLIDTMVNLLEGREQKIFKMRLEGLTLQHISLEFGLTRERIRQIEKKAIGKIKKRIEAAKGGEILDRREGDERFNPIPI